MRAILLLVAMLTAGCTADQVPEENGAAEGSGQVADRLVTRPERLVRLTGLYEGPGPEARNQLCIVEGREAEFGIVVWGAAGHACSGAGTVRRNGDRLRFAMAGDSACTIDAGIDGRSIVFPDDVPSTCAYYCGARASFAGTRLTQRGASVEDARKAKDPVGEPLCEAE